MKQSLILVSTLALGLFAGCDSSDSGGDENSGGGDGETTTSSYECSVDGYYNAYDDFMAVAACEEYWNLYLECYCADVEGCEEAAAEGFCLPDGTTYDEATWEAACEASMDAISAECSG